MPPGALQFRTPNLPSAQRVAVRRSMAAFAAFALLIWSASTAWGAVGEGTVSQSGLVIPQLPADMRPVFDGVHKFLANGEDVACGWAPMTAEATLQRIFGKTTEKAPIIAEAKRLIGIVDADLTSVSVRKQDNNQLIFADLISDVKVRNDIYRREIVFVVKRLANSRAVGGYCIYPAAKRLQRRDELSKLAAAAK